MKMLSLKPLGLLLAFTLCAMTVMAQDPKTKVKQTPAARNDISAEDQATIKALFVGVDERKYSLNFGGKVVAGKRTIAMKDLNQVKKVTNPAESAGYIVLIVEGNSVVYILAVGSSQLVNVLGQEKATKLNQVMAKYKR